jgi:Transglycosylase-like domain
MKVALSVALASSAIILLPSVSSAAPETVTISRLQVELDQHMKMFRKSGTVLAFFKNHRKMLYKGGMKTHKHNWKIVLHYRAVRSWRGKMIRKLMPRLASLRWANEGWTSRPDWMDYTWWRIGICESGQNPPNWRHNSGTFQGALGFYHGSWDAFRPPGYPSEAYLATPWQQVQVAERIRARYGYSGWGCY